MSLSLIESAILANKVLPRQMSVQAWAAEQMMLGEKVQLFRRYMDGDHRANMTTEMRKQLRLPPPPVSASASTNVKAGYTALYGSMNELNDNYCGVIVRTMADRLHVVAIEADNDAATQWAQELMDDNEFDAIQGDIYEACLRDANTYLMVDWDAKKSQVRWTPENAYDAASGVLVLYDENDDIEMAIKIWQLRVGDKDGVETCRVNVYYPDRIEKYVSRNNGNLVRFEVEGEAWPAPWVLPNGEPIGVPVVHFPNRKTGYNDYGVSELEDAIPLQDALNRVVVDTVMTADLTAFPIRTAVGIEPPADVTPGMFLYLGPMKDKSGKPIPPDEKMIEWFKSVKFGSIEPGEVMPFIQTGMFFKGEMFDVSSTPHPVRGEEKESGEAKKQREVVFLGKVKRFQPKAGIAWKRVIELSQRVQEAFGEKPPEAKRWTVKWKPPEIRNDAEIITNAKEIKDVVGDKEFLRQTAAVTNYTEARIAAILNEKKEQDAARREAFNQVNPFASPPSNPIPATQGGGVSNGFNRRTSEVPDKSVY